MSEISGVTTRGKRMHCFRAPAPKGRQIPRLYFWNSIILFWNDKPRQV